MNINKIVEQIIFKRNVRIPLIEAKKEELLNLIVALDSFDELKSEIIDHQGNILDGKYKIIATKNPEMPIKLNVLSTVECRKRIGQALAECDRAHNRFNRDSINIAVIGKARVGKSEFLKAISNLSNYVIPAFSETDCTGAVSIIENKPGIKLEANLTFKTESQIIAIVQTYLDRILPEPENRIVIRSLYQIRDLDLDEVNRRKTPSRKENNLVPYLTKFVEYYEQWAPLVKQHEAVLYDEKEIQEYVAQNNGKPDTDPARKSFFKYLAVDSCRISCTFDYQEAGKITLVDTVGFEDNAIGIEDELIRVVNDKSDAVVFVLFPLDGAGGGVPAKISDIYGKIETSCPGKNLDKWLFWLINHAPNHPKTPNPLTFCNQALKTLEVNCWAGEVRKIVDVSNQQQVREEFLIPLLNTLMGNLDDIDALYLKDLEKALSAVRKEFNSFSNAAKKVMDSEISSAASMQPQMYRNIQQMHEQLTGQLRMLSKKEKEKRDVPCSVLKDRVNGILQNMGTELVPSRDEILQELNHELAPVLYTKYCNQIRNKIVQQFASVDGSLGELVDSVKMELAQILYSEGGCKLGRILKASDPSKLQDWMHEFSDAVLNEQDYPILYRAFQNVYNFKFSVSGFLTYEVRACLDCLDPELTDTPALLGKTDVQTAQRIHDWLRINLKDVKDELEEDRLSNLFCNPHRAFFAMIKEFSDNVIYAENAAYEWNRLFSENYAVIWAEEYKNMAVAATAFGEWADMLEKLLDINSKLLTLESV